MLILIKEATHHQDIHSLPTTMPITNEEAIDEEAIEEELALARSQMAAAVAIAARKVEFQPKAESGLEMFTRINSAKEVKQNKAVKRAARKMVKTKKIKKMTAYFLRK
jgi:hypothetical protein